MSSEKKYHISDKTGNANICRAKNKCPLGENTPHFTSKEEANEYIEQKAKEEHYAFNTFTRSGILDEKESEAVATILAAEDSGAWDADNYLYEELAHKFEDFRIADSIEGIDYYNESLVNYIWALYHYVIQVLREQNKDPDASRFTA